MNSYYLSLKILVLNIKILPAIAGIKRLINQMPKVAPIMPSVLELYSANNSTLNLPRIPRSAIANEGTIANTKNKILIIQKPCNHVISI